MKLTEHSKAVNINQNQPLIVIVRLLGVHMRKNCSFNVSFYCQKGNKINNERDFTLGKWCSFQRQSLLDRHAAVVELALGLMELPSGLDLVLLS